MKHISFRNIDKSNSNAMSTRIEFELPNNKTFRVPLFLETQESVFMLNPLLFCPDIESKKMFDDCLKTRIVT